MPLPQYRTLAMQLVPSSSYRVEQKQLDNLNLVP